MRRFGKCALYATLTLCAVAALLALLAAASVVLQVVMDRCGAGTVLFAAIVLIVWGAIFSFFWEATK